MAEKKIFTDAQILRYAKVLDGAINFKKLFGKEKVFLFFKINLGKIAEKNDRVLWTKLLKFINSAYSSGKISDELAEVISSIFVAIDNSDEDELITILAKTIAGKIHILDSDSKEEILIKSALTMLATLDEEFLDQLNAEFDKLEEEADEQDS